MGESQSSEEDLPSTSGMQKTEESDTSKHEHNGRFDISEVQERPTNDETLPRNKYDLRKRMMARREAENAQKREELEMKPPGNWYIGGTEEDDVFDENRQVTSLSYKQGVQGVAKLHTQTCTDGRGDQNNDFLLYNHTSVVIFEDRHW